jgi:tRNA 2-thiouridine synthesizing protein A
MRNLVVTSLSFLSNTKPKGDLNKMKHDEELDARGLVCPVPALKAKAALTKMRAGAVLRVVTDYAPAKDSVPRDLAKTKHKFLGLENGEDDGTWYLFFQSVK